jgi:hypothetical protein
MRAGSCAATENALVDTHKMAPINSPQDQKIPFCINVPPSGNRKLDRSRPFANSIGNEAGTPCPQLVGKLEAFCRLIFTPSAISFAIGPSRTGISEKSIHLLRFR